MPNERSFHMDAEEFRKNGYAVIDWIAEYMKNLESYPVLSTVNPGDIRRQLPADPPQNGESFDSMLADINRIIMPGITHWQSPNFFAYFPANASAPAILGDLLSSGLGVQGMIWATSPACTELETHVMDWLVDMLALPGKFKSSSTGGGVIQDTASNASLTALLAARERACNYTGITTGLKGTFTAYTSNQAHSSIEKGAMVSGIGSKNLRLIESDDTFAMKPAALEQAIQADLAAGLKPFFISATVGTTSSNGMDPLREIGEIARRYNLWLHVDGAMSGTAALAPEFRWIHEGLEYADSYCFNPHKWMFTNFDCDAFFVADRAALIKTLSILPEYLKNKATESGAVIDYRDWHIQLGRRFRALKLWFVIRHYGVEGLRHHVRRHVETAQEFAGWVDSDEMFELTVKPPLNLVCFRMRGSDEENKELMDRLNASGKLFLTHTKLNDQFVLRMSIGGTNTRHEHVVRAWERIRETARSLRTS